MGLGVVVADGPRREAGEEVQVLVPGARIVDPGPVALVQVHDDGVAVGRWWRRRVSWTAAGAIMVVGGGSEDPGGWRVPVGHGADASMYRRRRTRTMRHPATEPIRYRTCPMSRRPPPHRMEIQSLPAQTSAGNPKLVAMIAPPPPQGFPPGLESAAGLRPAWRRGRRAEASALVVVAVPTAPSEPGSASIGRRIWPGAVQRNRLKR